MALLSEALLATINASPASMPQHVGNKYRRKVQARADKLNVVGGNAQNAAADSALLTSQASQLLFDDRVVTADHAGYEELQRANWTMAAWLPAKAISKLLNTVEVALALRIVTFFQCPFAIRSGGHQANPGFGSIGNSGILLDLGSMNSVTLSADRKVAILEPGARWGDVYEVLEKQELTVVGGRIAEVGVGGLILGGGMSHFSNDWGLACDHVKNFEVVLSDSRIVQANVEESPDLFRALKGGGPNFGVVTRFDLYTNEDYRLWSTLKVYSSADVQAVMKAAVAVEKAMEHDHRIGFFLTVKVDVLVAGMLYRGGAPPPTAFKAFSAIKPVTVAMPETEGSQHSLAHALSMSSGSMREVAAATVRPNPDLYVELYRIVQDIKSLPSCSYSFTFQPIGVPASAKSQQLGGNCMDVPSENQSWLAVTAEWTGSADDELARSGMRQLIDSLQSTASARGCLIDYHFMNDASYIQSPLKTLQKETLEFLEETSRKYDNQQAFQKLQSGGFLLSRV